MIKLLIFGGGKGAYRYIESLSFFPDIEITLTSFNTGGNTIELARKMSLKYVEFEDLNRNKTYDLIVISVQPWHNYNVLFSLYKKTENKLYIVDKPLSVDMRSFNSISSLVSRNCLKVLTGYNRRFDAHDFSAYYSSSYIIDYPIVQKLDNVSNNLPHLIDWLMLLENTSEMEISEFMFKGKNGQGILFGQINGKLFQINMKKNLNMSINGQEVPFPTLVSNYNIVKHLLNYAHHDILRLLKKDKSITQIIETINRRRVYE